MVSRKGVPILRVNTVIVDYEKVGSFELYHEKRLFIVYADKKGLYQLGHLIKALIVSSHNP